jgi:myosin heavy subunit
MMSERSDGLTTAARVWISQERDVWQPALLLHRTRDQAEVIIEADSSWVNAEPVSSPASSGSAKLQKAQSSSIFSRQPTVLCLAKAILVPRNPAHLEGIDDLVKLQFLDEPNILHNLSLRYSQGKIYTNTGPILIATNPWRHLDIYSEGAMDLYKGRDLGELPPHVYGIADSAYRAMLRERRNQVCYRSHACYTPRSQALDTPTQHNHTHLTCSNFFASTVYTCQRGERSRKD